MSQAFMCHRRKTHRGSGSLRPRSLSAVPQSPGAKTGRVLAAPAGPFELWSEGVWHQDRIGEPIQALTSMRATEGFGAAGLPGCIRRCACVLTALARLPPHSRVLITQGFQVGSNDGTTPQATAGARALCHPP
jgi:hypothetical protein